MNDRYKSKPEHDAIVLDESKDPIERARAIRLLGIDGRTEHEAAFEQLTTHAHPEIRSTALQILLSWGREAYLPAGIHGALSDPHPDARNNVIFGLQLFARLHESGLEPVCRALYQVVAKDEDCQAFAYRAILELLGAPGGASLDPLEFDPVRDVDWELLAPYAEPLPGPH